MTEWLNKLQKKGQWAHRTRMPQSLAIQYLRVWNREGTNSKVELVAIASNRSLRCDPLEEASSNFEKGPLTKMRSNSATGLPAT